ncbi:MAG: sn-glycerol-3-phosphate ABC transporter ATP-binding protein UgpC [Hyphomicrobiales bacterium]|nr:sn-glycerol-3-phosphate ABC transporter ATP-binding protein UgpC [Hyphomicrobiales bacterium]
MSDLRLDGVKKRFGTAEIIKGVDLSVDSGAFMVFVGPSGCGKSTLLRMISGLESVSAGQIAIAGRDVTRLPPSDRQVAMVFQSYALYPHMTAEENMSFGLRMTGAAKDDVAGRVAEAARILQIEPLMDRKPKQLSGGQRQRVAIGRAIVRKPKVFLFDEPLSNLDAALRVQMRVEIARLHADIGATMVYVTHDQVEAMTLADRIVVLNHGTVEQIGAPLELYERPANRFVAGFLGQPRINFLDAVVSSRDDRAAAIDLAASGRPIRVPAADALTVGASVTVGVRPDAMTIVDEADADLAARVEVVEHLGPESIIYAAAAGSAGLLTVVASGKTQLRHGDQVFLRLGTEGRHVFANDGTAIV